MTRLLALLCALLAAPALAQSPQPESLQGAHFISADDRLGATGAVFRLGLSRDGGASYTNTAGAADAVTIRGDILPAPAHLGQRADVFIVDRINGKFTMKDVDGNFVSWNGRVPDLVPAQEDVVLSAETRVEVFSGPLGIGGDHRLFIGYMVDGELHYTPYPHVVSISGGNSSYLIQSGSDVLKPGSMLSFDYQGPALDAATLTVTVDGIAARAKVDGSQLHVAIPPGAAGPAEVMVSAAGTTLRHSVTVQPGTPIPRPREYVGDVVDQVLAEWKDNPANPFPTLYGALVQARQQINGLNEADAALLAALLQQVLADDDTLARMFALQDATACDIASTSFLDTVIEVVNGNRRTKALIALGTGLLLVEPHIAVPVFAVAGWKIWRDLRKVEGVVDGVVDSCVGPTAVAVEQVFGNGMGLQALTAASRDFTHGTEQRLSLRVTRSLQNAAFSASFVRLMTELRQQIQELGTKFGFDPAPLLAYLQVDGVGPQTLSDLSDLTLRVDHSSVTGTITARGNDWLGIVLNFSGGVSANEANVNVILSSARHGLDVTIPARLVRGTTQLELSGPTGFVLPNTATGGVDESRIFRIVQFLRSSVVSSFTLKNTGTASVTLTSASLEGAPDGFSWQMRPQTLTAGGSTTITLSLAPTAATYAQLAILHDRAPGKRFFINLEDADGKRYRYALEFWFVHYGAYDITRVASSTQPGCTLGPPKTFSTIVTGTPYHGIYHVRMNNVEIPRTTYASDGSMSFARNYSYGEQEGIVVENLALSIDLQGRLTGTSTWTWSDDEDECRGTATYTGQVR